MATCRKKVRHKYCCLKARFKADRDVAIDIMRLHWTGGSLRPRLWVVAAFHSGSVDAVCCVLSLAPFPRSHSTVGFMSIHMQTHTHMPPSPPPSLPPSPSRMFNFRIWFREWKAGFVSGLGFRLKNRVYVCLCVCWWHLIYGWHGRWWRWRISEWRQH